MIIGCFSTVHVAVHILIFVLLFCCCTELTEVLYRRVVVIRGLTMEEFAHQRLLEIMSRSNEFRVNFVFKENSSGDGVGIQSNVEALWEG